MDIKQVWVEEYARSAYILSIIDTFTRTVLYRTEGYQMTQYEVKAAWEHVIVNYLQPADLMKKGLHVEIRYDNGPQFAARMVREFLLENGIHQVFTYPYCPDQNGHIESFNYSSLRLASPKHREGTVGQHPVFAQRRIMFGRSAGFSWIYSDLLICSVKSRDYKVR